MLNSPEKDLYIYIVSLLSACSPGRISFIFVFLPQNLGLLALLLDILPEDWGPKVN